MSITFFNSVVVLALASRALAESHTLKFTNNCGYGTPVLIQDGKSLTLTDNSYTSNGVFSSAIAYLQTGDCLYNGEGCALLEMSLQNPTTAGTGSSTDISLISPHALNVPVAFSYYNGCENLGTTECTTADCSTAFFVPDDNQVQVACQSDNVNLLMTFCPSGSSSGSSSSSTSSSKKTSATSTSTSATSSASVKAAVVTTSSSTASTTSTVSTTSSTSTSAAAATTSRKSCSTKRSKLAREVKIAKAARDAMVVRSHRSKHAH